MTGMKGRLGRLVAHDAGFTLPEMIAATALFALVTLIAVSMFVSSLGVQQTVTQVSATNVDAQLAATSVETGIRNSTALDLSDPDLLIAEVAGTDPAALTYRCQAWYFDAADGGSLWMTSAPVGDAIDAPEDSADLSSWVLLVRGVEPLTGGVVFTRSGATVGMAFQATAGDNRPVDIAFSTTSMSGATGETTCF